MVKLTKKQKHIQETVDFKKEYSVEEAVGILKSIGGAKFQETLEVACSLNIDPKKSDQTVRGSVVLPHGLGKNIRVLVFCKGEKEREAKDSGADFVGNDELIEKIKSGWMDFDVAIATPDMMREVGKIGKVLGPRGLMPSPKSGTVTDQLGKAVKESKAGKLDYRMDKAGTVNVGLGKISFSKEQLTENVQSFLDSLVRVRPASTKGQFIKGVHMSTTMGPGLKISFTEVLK
ncbi:MAG: 50S ribosomal protein L1 [Candidatus Omnitrophica bacterium]|nr:50S ribosomal protein L1 [Candidatus Omnitrophota bacterium]